MSVFLAQLKDLKDIYVEAQSTEIDKTHNWYWYSL